MVKMLKLGVGDKIFEIEKSSVINYPDTMLGRMFTSSSDLAKSNENGVYQITWDYDSTLFESLLDYYRHGNFALPANCGILHLKEACDYLLIPFTSKTVNNVDRFCFDGYGYGSNNNDEIEFRYDLITYFKESSFDEWHEEDGILVSFDFHRHASEQLRSFQGTQDSNKWNAMRMLFFKHGLFISCRKKRFTATAFDRNNKKHTDWYPFRN